MFFKAHRNIKTIILEITQLGYQQCIEPALDHKVKLLLT